MVCPETFTGDVRADDPLRERAFRSIIRRQARLLHLPHRSEPSDDVVGALGLRPLRMRFASSSALGSCEFVLIEPGLVLSIIDVSLAEGLRAPLSGEGFVEFTYRLLGSMSLVGNWGKVECSAGSLLIWCQPCGHDDVFEQVGAGRERELSITIHVDPDWWQAADGSDRETITPLMRGVLPVADSPAFRLEPIRTEAEAVLNAILNCADDGGMRLISLKARTYELLGLTLRDGLAARSQDPGLIRSRRDIDRIDDARTILEREYAAPPKLEAVMNLPRG